MNSLPGLGGCERGHCSMASESWRDNRPVEVKHDRLEGRAALRHHPNRGCLAVADGPKCIDAALGAFERHRGQEAAGGLRIKQKRIERMPCSGFEITGRPPQTDVLRLQR